MRADKPYNEIPLLPPTVDLETKAILKQCIQARAALAELKGAAELIPNPSILINTLPLLEAQASSEIENIVTTTDRLFQFRELHAQADAAHSHELMNLIAILPHSECDRTENRCSPNGLWLPERTGESWRIGRESRRPRKAFNPSKTDEVANSGAQHF